MNLLLKWTLFFTFLMLFYKPGHAFSISQKGRVNGPSIHTTYFLTPNNQGFDVRATAVVGKWNQGNCVYGGQIELGQDFLRTGDFVDLDAFRLKSIVGGGYSCLTIYYHYRQPVIDTVALIWDGSNYVATVPSTSEVTIL